MNKKIQTLHPQESFAIGQTSIALVQAVQNGKATTILHENHSNPIAVAGHSGQVDLLKEGDQVLFLQSSDGPIILSRLLGDQEQVLPRMSQVDGVLQIEAASRLCLQCGKSRVEMSADGEITLNGQEIQTVAQGRNILKGSTVELN